MGHGAWSIEKNPKFAIRNSQFEIKLLTPDSWILTPYVCLVPATLAAYAAKVAVDPTQLIAKVLPSS